MRKGKYNDEHARIDAMADCAKASIMTVRARTDAKGELQRGRVLSTIDERRIKRRFGFVVRLIANEYYRIHSAIYSSYL